MKRVLFCAFCLLSLTAAAGEKKTQFIPADREGMVNSVLASVNGVPVLLGDIMPMTRIKEYQAYAAYSGKRLEEVILELRRKAVDEIINRKLVIADYQKQPVKINSRDVEAELDRIAVRMNCHSRKDFWRKLMENGIELEKLRSDVEERMIVQLMQYKQMTIAGEPTPKELYEYFTKNTKEFSGTESIELAMLRLDSKRADFKEAADDAEKTLREFPDKFSELVRKYTPEHRDGRLGEIECSKLRPEFQCVLNDKTVGKVYGPLKIDDGVVWLKLLAHKEPVKVTFKDVEHSIREKLATVRREKAFEKYTESLRKEAIVVYFF